MAPNPMNESTIQVIKSCAPILATEGTKITCRMYQIMFDQYPVVKNLFNSSHVRPSGDTKSVPVQAQALANAVLAYAANVDNLSALTDAVNMMVHKHVSFNVLPEHYDIVGKCLITAIKDVLGDQASDQVVDAWKEAYKFLADLLIDLEEKLRKDNASKQGGWFGFKNMLVADKIKETDSISSFILKTVDGSPVPDFKPGQYLSFRIPKGEIEGFEHDIVRNYSLSVKPGRDFYRISIKKELSNDLVWPDGVSSSYFHDRVHVGSQVQVGMPCGTFVLDEQSTRPIVLIAGGVGLTPMISMLEALMSSDCSRQVVFIQCCKSSSDYAMKSMVDDLCAVHGNLTSHVFYSSGSADDSSLKYTIQHRGRISAQCLESMAPSPVTDNEFYFCGPPSFLGHVRKMLAELKVPDNQTHYEYFGPAQQ